MSEILGQAVKEIEAEAHKKGLVVVYMEDDELALDLDGGASMRLDVLTALNANRLIVSKSLTTVSKSLNKHLYLKIIDPNTLQPETFTPIERIALQAALGSDPIRELLSTLRAKMGSECPSVMFETVQESLNVARWRLGA